MNEVELSTLKVNIRNKINESVSLTKENHRILEQKKFGFNKQLKKCNKLKNELLDFYRKILGEYNILLENSNADSKKLELLYTYVEGVRVHFSIQQDDWNQLSYKNSMRWAYVAVWATVIFSITSIVLTLCPCLSEKLSICSNTPKTKFLSDSINTLNGKIDQQNEIIQKYFSISTNDSILNPTKK